jgi:hypothetical protein
MAKKVLTPEEQAAAKAAEEQAAAKAKAEADAKKTEKGNDVKSRLETETEKHFKNYPSCKVIFATADGNFWLDQHEGLARSYAKEHHIELYEFKR